MKKLDPILLTSVALLCPVTAAQESKPNVMLIAVDDLND